MITDIQRFSLNDGPGIRTTVFLKGCPLACAWCHNPESLQPRAQLLTYPQNCNGCGACLAACHTGARAMREGALSLDRALCTACGACADVCFTGALVLSGKALTAEQVVDEVCKDKPYYDRSGGGVTLSGGEALMQPQLCEEILTLCRARGIATAIETSLGVPWASLAKLLPLLDLIMLDIKLLDDAAHRRWVGASNAPILENLARLARTDTPLIIRTPIIPGVNDTEETVAAIAAHIADIPHLRCYELLNFNPLGDGKYAALDMSNPFAEARPLPDPRMRALADAAMRAAPHLTVRIG